DRDGDRAAVRVAPGRRGADRIRVRRARRRPSDRRGDPAARLSDRAGRRLRAGDHHRDGELPGGRSLRLSEPDDPASLMAVTLPQSAVAYEVALPPGTGSRAWRRFALNPAALVGSLILLVMVSAAATAPWIAPHDPAKQSLLRRFTPPMGQARRRATHPPRPPPVR